MDRVLVCLVGPAGSPATPPNPLKVRDSFSDQHATVGLASPIYTLWLHGQDPPGSWCRVGMPAVCTVGPRVNADNGRSDVPQEPKSLQASPKVGVCTRRVKRPSWVYYVLGAAVKTDQKSRAAQRHCWDRVGIRGNI